MESNIKKTKKNRKSKTRKQKLTDFLDCDVLADISRRKQGLCGLSIRVKNCYRHLAILWELTHNWRSLFHKKRRIFDERDNIY